MPCTQAKVPKTVGGEIGETFGDSDFVGLGKWCARCGCHFDDFKDCSMNL